MVQITAFQTRCKPNLTFRPPPNSVNAWNCWASPRGITNSQPSHLDTWYHTGKKEGHKRNKCTEDSDGPPQKTPHPIGRKRHTTPDEIATRRDPIKEELPRENNHFRRSPRLPTWGDCLQNHPFRDAYSRQTLDKIGIGRLHGVPTIGSDGPRPPILPHNPRRPIRDHKEIIKELRFPNEKSSSPGEIPNPAPPSQCPNSPTFSSTWRERWYNRLNLILRIVGPHHGSCQKWVERSSLTTLATPSENQSLVASLSPPKREILDHHKDTQRRPEGLPPRWGGRVTNLIAGSKDITPQTTIP